MTTLSLVERLALAGGGGEQYLTWYCHYCLAPLRRSDEADTDQNVPHRWIAQDGRRFYLGRVPATIDHVVPRSAGGTNNPANLVICCRNCNSLKGNRPLWAFEALTKEWMWRNRHFMVWIHLEWAQFYHLKLTQDEIDYNVADYYQGLEDGRYAS